MAKPYNKDAARLVEGFIDEKIAGLFAEGGAGAQAIAAAIAAHEAKEAGDDFANSHVVAAG